MKSSLGIYVKTATCKCGWFQKVWEYEVCPECGNEDLVKKVGRFEYKETWFGSGDIIGFKSKEYDEKGN